MTNRIHKGDGMSSPAQETWIVLEHDPGSGLVPAYHRLQIANRRMVRLRWD